MRIPVVAEEDWITAVKIMPSPAARMGFCMVVMNWINGSNERSGFKAPLITLMP